MRKAFVVDQLHRADAAVQRHEYPALTAENLRILSLSRNQIKKIQGLDDVGATLQQLWLSYNNIDSLQGLGGCSALQVLYVAHNKIKDWNEVDRLKENKNLRTLVLLGNEIYTEKSASDAEARLNVLRRLPLIDLLDGRGTFDEKAKIAELDGVADA